MSTQARLAGIAAIVAQSSGLRIWTPSRPVLRVTAELYLSDAVRRRLAPANDGANHLRAETVAAFDQFVELGPVVYRLFDETWGKLGIAQMKITSPKPGSRLVGGFADPAVYVGLRLYWRNELDFKPAGQIGVIDYRTLGREMADEWKHLLPSIKPMPMRNFVDE